MDAFLISMGIVALAEMGDKTQLLAFLLASRFKKPYPIIIGIFIATLINHVLAGGLGMWITTLIAPDRLQWILGFSFILMGFWAFIPDKPPTGTSELKNNIGVFAATFTAFFLGEIGDKTQIATIALTAHYASPISVITGTTLGMLLADIPAVFLGNKFAEKISMKFMHACAAGIFILFGLLTLPIFHN